jgi:phage terminase large subunit-like protein
MIKRASRERRKPVGKMTRGERVIAFIHEYCKVPEGRLVGQPLRLAPFQKKFILDIYDNPYKTHTAILSMARKNAKSATIACLLLVHICGPEARQNTQIVSGAMSREQAALVFNLAAKMIRLDERLTKVTRIVPSVKLIAGLAMGVEYKAISAEATTAFGLSPVLAILDEVGQIIGPSSPFIEAVTTAQGAHENPLLIAISTSAASDADMLSLWIDDAKRSGDPCIVVHEYKADDNCDLMDEEQWKKANPALGLFRSEDDLRKQLQKASRLPALESGARNLLLNQRVSLQSLWLAPTPWKECAGAPDMSAFADSQNTVALGLDLSARVDLTAAVVATTDDAGWTHIVPFVFTPAMGLKEREQRDRAPYTTWVKQGFLITCPGSSVDYEWVAEYLRLKFDEMGIRVDKLCFDRWRIEQFKIAADAKGFAQEAEWKEIGQGYKDFSPRMTAFEHLLLSSRLRHGGHPLLNMAAANAISVKDPAGNTKLDKAKSTQRIDPLVAAVMAVFEVTENAASDGFDAAAMIG